MHWNSSLFVIAVIYTTAVKSFPWDLDTSFETESSQLTVEEQLATASLIGSKSSIYGGESKDPSIF